MMLCVHGSPLYQWDINRQLLIDSADLGSDFVIHCCYTEDSNAPVVEPIIDGDKVLVNIPNILLQRFGHLRVYVVVEGDTVYDATFYVMARPKPDDYVYTETEVLSYESLAKRMDDFEKNGVSEEKIAKAVSDYLDENPITETDPTIPEWAKAPEKPTYTAKDVGALPEDTLIPSIDGLATEKYVDEKVAGIKIPESGTTDYTQLTNKPKINGVELDGDKTLEALGIPTGGGSEKKWRLLRTVTIPEDITTDTSGVNFAYATADTPEKGVIFGFDTDEDGQPFECTELLTYTNLAAHTGTTGVGAFHFESAIPVYSVHGCGFLVVGVNSKPSIGVGRLEILAQGKVFYYNATFGGGSINNIQTSARELPIRVDSISKICGFVANGGGFGFTTGSKFTIFGR